MLSPLMLALYATSLLIVADIRQIIVSSPMQYHPAILLFFFAAWYFSPLPCFAAAGSFRLRVSPLYFSPPLRGYAFHFYRLLFIDFLHIVVIFTIIEYSMRSIRQHDITPAMLPAAAFFIMRL